jgi:hypothetical protein
MDADNRVGLAVGTLLAEAHRHEGWGHYGCIPSIRTLIAELEVAGGPLLGEHTEVVLEQGYEYDTPCSGLESRLEDVQGAIPRQ